ncbi:MAG: hypothetical protein ABFC89_11000 [Methanospirillum sp.]
MTQKAGIINEFGGEVLLLPALIEGALVGNERAKYFFSLLQAARQHAEHPGKEPLFLRPEREAAGIEDLAFEEIVPGTVSVGDGRYRIPFLDRVLDGIQEAIDGMVGPLVARGGPDAEAFRLRWEALRVLLRSDGSGEIGRTEIGAITSGDRSAGDTPHLLVMDLHRALTALVEGLGCVTLDGARTCMLDDGDRELVRAFMSGLGRTESLRFDHPGLGTTAIRMGDRLLIENEIGVTGAHLLMVTVVGTTVTVTCTDVHSARLSFFRSLLDGWEVEWSETISRSAPRSIDGVAYHITIGRFAAPDRDRCLAFLDYLGSRIVFLIDWNKARKQLRFFLSNEDAVAVLRRAATNEIGHRAFLEIGGANLVDGALDLAARRPEGRLDEQLGRELTMECLGQVLWIAAEGLLRGDPRSQLRERCRAELLGAFGTARDDLLERCTFHAALVLEEALVLHNSLGVLRSGVVTERVLSNAALARHREREADVLVRRTLGHSGRRTSGLLTDLIEMQDRALDALEEGCYYAVLLDGMPFSEDFEVLEEMADLSLAAGRSYLQTLSAAQQSVAGPGLDRDFYSAADRILAIRVEFDLVRGRTGGCLATGANEALHPDARAGLVQVIGTSIDALIEAVALLRGAPFLE